jgi:hypothetical protein
MKLKEKQKGSIKLIQAKNKSPDSSISIQELYESITKFIVRTVEISAIIQQINGKEYYNFVHDIIDPHQHNHKFCIITFHWDIVRLYA